MGNIIWLLKMRFLVIYICVILLALVNANKSKTAPKKKPVPEITEYEGMALRFKQINLVAKYKYDLLKKKYDKDAKVLNENIKNGIT